MLPDMFLGPALQCSVHSLTNRSGSFRKWSGMNSEVMEDKYFDVTQPVCISKDFLKRLPSIPRMTPEAMEDKYFEVDQEVCISIDTEKDFLL